MFILAHLPPSAGCWNEVLLVGLIPPGRCVSRSWSRGKHELRVWDLSECAFWFGSFLVVVLPLQQEMENWCLCVSDSLRVSGTCALGDITVC